MIVNDSLKQPGQIMCWRYSENILSYLGNVLETFPPVFILRLFKTFQKCSGNCKSGLQTSALRSDVSGLQWVQCFLSVLDSSRVQISLVPNCSSWTVGLILCHLFCMSSPCRPWRTTCWAWRTMSTGIRPHVSPALSHWYLSVLWLILCLWPSVMLLILLINIKLSDKHFNININININLNKQHYVDPHQVHVVEVCLPPVAWGASWLPNL